LKNKLISLLAGLFTALISACASQNPAQIKPVSYVDLNQFMGDWYVIACIPTVIETAAYNAIESYQLEKDGTINTTFVFRKSGFDGPEMRYNPSGFVVENTRSGACNSSGLSSLNLLLRISTRITPAPSLPEMPGTMFG
jgi:apolipoprotein D and lipocalin family protein